MIRLDETPASALAIYAHPDDADVSCGATLARWAASGSDVHVIVVARGDKGSADPGTDPEELARRRSEEVGEAASALGVASHRVLGYGDGEFDNDLPLRRTLVEAIRELRPEAVVAPDPTAVFFGTSYFNHLDHRVVGWAALDAVSPAAASPLYFPDAGPVHRVSMVLLSGALEPDAFVDVEGYLERKAAAVRCHSSQIGESADVVEELLAARAAEAARGSGAAQAETFRLLRLQPDAEARS